jgi:hypothetical protein
MNIDWKCSITLAILTVLIYLLLVNVFRSFAKDDAAIGTSGENVEWYKSLEAFIIYATLISYNVNQMLFASCKL